MKREHYLETVEWLKFVKSEPVLPGIVAEAQMLNVQFAAALVNEKVKAYSNIDVKI